MKETPKEGWLGSMSDRGRVVGDVISPATDPSEREALGPALPA
ncbi:MAG: hypothetical protein WEG36_09680 [Gemmatimonadota bacterium]